MTRHKLTVAAVTGVFLLLAWIWPDGDASDPPALNGSESTASGAPAPMVDGDGESENTDGAADSSEGEASSEAPDPGAAEPSGEPTGEPAPGPEVPEVPGGELASNTYAGPLGTRNHTGTDAVALTFDDGPDPNWTPKVLEALRERGIKAMFCVIGAYAEANPDIIADIVHDGHTLCNHTWFHQFDLGTWGEGEIRANLRRTNDAIEKAAPGAEVKYFRHPGGQWTDRAIGVAAELGMESLHWTVDPSDWDNGTTEAEIRDIVLERSGPGSVVLLHDGASNQEDMLGALGAILDEFENRGYAYTPL
ncbi:polysaccharide deacetylase family protein [Glycomyces buryatensis]|uniref:polysaccharide deacetylase family protein n=1 Tax=Glycomyces buryatensis TaxID=2570927 RepID=UPI0014562F55|nr:polysaccharide deacetylase family protein [Glycomyces buryatensis]